MFRFAYELTIADKLGLLKALLETNPETLDSVDVVIMVPVHYSLRLK